MYFPTVPAVLRGNTLHGEKASDQHAGGREQRSPQTQIPPTATHQGLHHHTAMPEGNRSVTASRMHHFNPVLTSLSTMLSWACFPVKAVYDVTLNFKDKENPTLLGVINGKKYKADMRVRRVHLHVYIVHAETLIKECVGDWLIS